MSEGPIITGRLRLKDETGKTLDSLKGKFGGALKTLTKIGAGIGAAAAGGMALSIREAAGFEKVLAKVMAATGKTGEEAERLKTFLSDAAQTMGPEFGRSATDAMEALEALVKAGLEGEDAVEALRGALQLATLEGLENEAASNMLVQSMTMFGLKAEDAGRIIDLFSAASDAGIDTAAGFASGISNVGATASAMGFSMEETMAALVQLDKTFGGAQESGTFLNRMLLDMAAKAGDAGLEIYNADGSMRSLDEIVGQVRTTLDGYGDDQEAANKWLGQFDTRAQKAILGLAEYDGTIDETQTGLGEMQSAQDKVNTVMDTFSGRMDTLKARVQGMAVSLGEDLMPYTEDFFAVVEQALPTITSMIKGFADFTSEVYDLATAFMEGEWDYAFDKLEEIYGNISAKFKEWWDAIDWGEVWSGFKEFAGTLWERFKIWAGSIGTAFFNWFGTVEWENVFSKLSEWMSSFWDWLYNQAAVDIQTAFTNWVKTVDWVAVFKSLGEFAIRLPLWIIEQIGKAAFNFGYHMAAYIDSIDWGEVFNAIGLGVVEALKGAAATLLDWMPNWLKKLLGLKDIPPPPPPPPPPTTVPTTPPPTVTPPTIPPPAPPPTIQEPWGGAERHTMPPPAPPPTVPGPWGGAERHLFQHGFEGVVRRPTWFLAGEAGPEHVSVTPRGRAAAPAVNITIDLHGAYTERPVDPERLYADVSGVVRREMRRMGTKWEAV